MRSPGVSGPTPDGVPVVITSPGFSVMKRETCSTFIVVMDGQGFSEIGGARFDWEKNDIMAVPNFMWRRHVNTGKNDAVLYKVSDAAVLRAIGQYRAQGQTAKGEVVQIEQ